MVLSETRGLRLSWVIPGCIGLTRRLGAQRQLVYRRFGYLPWNPSVSRTDWPPSEQDHRRWMALHRDAQAACNFSFSASKSSPFFQSVSVMAAILRASVSRAMVGLMPLAIEARYKSCNGPGRALAVVATALNKPFRSWLWSLFRPRMESSFLERRNCPCT